MAQAANSRTSKPKLPPISSGQQYGRLTAIEFVDRTNSDARWRFKCSCGNEIVARARSVRSGNTQSCGCFMRERNSIIHATHRLRNTPEYTCWSSMLSRTRNPNVSSYERYGGRGIKVCERWYQFENFLADMGPRPAGTSIDRIDNDLGYFPGNCRWATSSQQNSNQQRNRFVIVDGKTMTRSEAARILGIRPDTVTGRVWRGWSEDEALFTPCGRRRQTK